MNNPPTITTKQPKIKQHKLKPTTIEINLLTIIVFIKRTILIYYRFISDTENVEIHSLKYNSKLTWTYSMFSVFIQMPKNIELE